MLTSPLSVVGLTGLLTAITLLLSRPDSGEQIMVIPEPVESVKAKPVLPVVTMKHQFVGSGLKRDYRLSIDLPFELSREKRKYTLLFHIPRSLIVDEFRLNRLRVNGLEDEWYECDRVVDLESGTWAPTSTPFNLKMTFSYPSVPSVSNEQFPIVIPEMMARYHQQSDNCFGLPAPEIQVSDTLVDTVTDPPLRQCVPVSPPSLIVPILTILTPFLGSLYLIRHINNRESVK